MKVLRMVFLVCVPMSDGDKISEKEKSILEKLKDDRVDAHMCEYAILPYESEGRTC